MEYMFEFKEIGELKLNKVFFESYQPILFTCINQENEHFLCVCCEITAVTKKWLVTKIQPKKVIDLLSDKLTIRNTFLEGEEKFSIYLTHEGWRIEENNSVDWDAENSIYLPSAGEFMEVEEDEFKEEIEYFENIMQLDTNQFTNTLDIKEGFKGCNLKLGEYTKDILNMQYTSILSNALNQQEIKILINETKTYCFSLHRVTKQMPHINDFEMNIIMSKSKEENEEFKVESDTYLALAS